MKLSLIHLKQFSQIQGDLESITPEMLAAVKGGNPLPEKATMIGQMPDTLKALLYLHLRALEVAKKFRSDALARLEEMSEEEGRSTVTSLYALIRSAQESGRIFWSTLNAEFPNQPDGSRINYGPNFEVYVEESPPPAGLGSVVMILTGHGR